MMCLNSRENFEDNKRYLKKRMEEETNTVVRKLLEKDANYLDRMQVQMATAREFLLIIRLREKKGNEIFSYLNRIEKIICTRPGIPAAAPPSARMKPLNSILPPWAPICKKPRTASRR